MFPWKKRQIHVCIFPNCDFQRLILLPTIKKIFIIQVYPLQGIISTTINLMRRLHSCRAHNVCSPHTHTCNIPHKQRILSCMAFSIAKSFACLNNPTTGQTSHTNNFANAKSHMQERNLCSHHTYIVSNNWNNVSSNRK